MLAVTEMIFVSMVEHAKRSVKPTTEGLHANAGQVIQGGFATKVRVIGLYSSEHVTMECKSKMLTCSMSLYSMEVFSFSLTFLSIKL